MRYETEINEKSGTPICNTLGQYSEDGSESNLVNLFGSEQTPYIAKKERPYV